MGVFRTTIDAPAMSVALGDRVRRIATPPPVLREYRLKRVLDFTLASIGLLASAPLWLALAVAIKLDDSGPVFYRQMRWGRHKRPFEVLKFRSMVADADQRFGAVQAGENDPRFTRVGRFLRATSLDELPQLLNIWRGEMSWVGPRALPMNERQVNEATHVPDDAVRGFDLRCAVRPGLTGIAQVFAPRDVPRHHKFRYDGFYGRHQSLWLDIKLIAISVWISLRLRWETRDAKLSRRPRRRG